jgi:hypothetical protein
MAGWRSGMTNLEKELVRAEGRVLQMRLDIWKEEQAKKEVIDEEGRQYAEIVVELRPEAKNDDVTLDQMLNNQKAKNKESNREFFRELELRQEQGPEAKEPEGEKPPVTDEEIENQYKQWELKAEEK